jgi:hypothetical protein
MMKAALRLCDEARHPAYLEAISRRSIPFYRSHRFEPVREIALVGSPPIVPMLRPAR